MVGGYAILTDTVLGIGDNNLVDIYGSVEAATERLNALSSIGKPVLVKFRAMGATAVLSGWFELVDVVESVYTMKSSAYTMSYNITNGILRISITH